MAGLTVPSNNAVTRRQQAIDAAILALRCEPEKAREVLTKLIEDAERGKLKESFPVHIVGCNIDRTVEAFGTAIQRGAAHTFAPPHGGGNCTICALPEGDHS